MKFGGKLTEADVGESYAVCRDCETVYRDDCREFGTIRCPVCRDALERGLSRERAVSLLDVSEKRRLD